MTLERLNERLNKINLNLNVNKCSSYDDGKVKYDTWLQYWNKSKNKWGILHTLGYFTTMEVAISKTIEFLKLNKINY